MTRLSQFENAVAEKYFSGGLTLPGPLLQRVLDFYLEWYYRLKSRRTDDPIYTAPDTEEIAVNSQELMNAHYNLPFAFFQRVLGRTLKYSMGLWETGAADLDAAQEAMMADLCAKAGLDDGQTMLDHGCGFGSFAEYVLRRYPRSRVWGVTLSRTQVDYLHRCQAQPDHPFSGDRFTVVEQDFNHLSLPRTFDRVISIGAFEHISNLDKALAQLRALVARGGVCLLHFIVFRPAPGEPATPRRDPFIDRYIFPGGRIRSFDQLAEDPRHFHLTARWYLSGRNYQRTLQAWLGNFLRHREALLEAGLSPRTLRILELYLRTCSAMFGVRGGVCHGNGQYRLEAH